MVGYLKDRLLETLKYPRYLMRTEIGLEQCPNDGQYSEADAHCRDCVDGEDCRWLLAQENESALSDRPLEQLISALGYAIESVDSLIDPNQHDPLCHCDTCLWRKQADSLYGEARCHPDLGPPQPH